MNPILTLLPDRLRGFVDINWFSYWRLHRSNKALAISSIVVFLSGVVGAATSLIEWQVSILAIALGIVGVAKDFISFYIWVFRRDDVRLRTDGDVEPIFDALAITDTEHSRGFSLDYTPCTNSSGFDEIVVRSKSFDSFLQSTNIPIAAEQELASTIDDLLAGNAHVYDSALREQFRQSPRQRFFNEAKVSLASDPTETELLRIFQSTYFDSFLTNELSTKLIETRGERPQILFYGSKHFPATKVENKWVLKTIADSCMNNHIGVSTVVITADNKLVLWRQSDLAQQSQLLLAPTGSGSCDWSDWASLPSKDKNLKGLLLRTMEREFKEESHPLATALRDATVVTHPLGFFRWVRRGGKPEFVGVSTVSKQLHELRPNILEVDKPTGLINYPAETKDQLLASVNQVMSQVNLSVPLWVTLTCLKEALESRSPPAFSGRH